jgi:uncharacterized glyoxalase superfamily protein PhnB
MSLDRLIPMQPVGDLAASIAFYEKLGFVVERRVDEWAWAMLRCGECRIMLDRSINLHAGLPRTAVLYLHPQDVEQFHRDARANGLAVPDLETTFYGMREFRIDDPDGNRLWIGQERPLPEAEPWAG